MVDLKKLQKEIYQNKVDKGFNVTDVNKEFCLTYGELSEAYEAWRKKKDDLGEELADVAIYLLGLSEILEINIEDEIQKKVYKNAKREYKVIDGVNTRVKEFEEVKERTDNLINKLLELWEDSVKATHTFLSNEEIEKIKTYVPQALISIEHLIIVKNENQQPIAFMGIEKNRLEMLFIKNSERRKGIGKQLLNYGIERYGVNELTVNEQNPQAKGFYEHMGFKAYQRNELDDQGNPYPVLYMRLEK